MKVKKYVVREMQEAMRLIREDMGPDAVIISSHRLPRKNIFDFFRHARLEVTAALDEQPPVSFPPAGLPPGRGEAAPTVEVTAAAIRCASGSLPHPYPAVVRTVLTADRFFPAEAEQVPGRSALTAAAGGPPDRALRANSPAPGAAQSLKAGVLTGEKYACPPNRPPASVSPNVGDTADSPAPSAALPRDADKPPGEERCVRAGTRVDRPSAASPTVMGEQADGPLQSVQTGENGQAEHAGAAVFSDGSKISTIQDKITLAGQENGPSSFNIILKQQEEFLMDGDLVSRWREKLLDVEIPQETVEDLLAGLNDPNTGGEEADDLLRVRLKSRIAALVEPAYRRKPGIARTQSPGAAGSAAAQSEASANGAGYQTGGEDAGTSERPQPEGAASLTPTEQPDERFIGQAAGEMLPLSGTASPTPTVRPGERFAGQAAGEVLPLEGTAGPGGCVRAMPAAVYAFVGPTGVGKTTTLAKMATRMSVFENKRLALIALYSHRFGLAEELKFYGETLGVPAEVVMTPAELAAAVQKHRDKDAVFIDSEGVSWRNAAQMLNLQGFMKALGDRREIFLVLSATTRSRDLQQITGAFERTGYTQLIFTKLDETAVHGPALNLVRQTGRPVAYVTNGQNVPDDLEAVTPRRLAALLLGDAR